MRLRLAIERFLMLAAMMAVAGTALIYPLKIRDDWNNTLLQWMMETFAEGRLYFEMLLRPILQFGYDPLVLKETFGAIVAVLLLVIYVPWKVLYWRNRGERLGLHLPLMAFLLLAGVSMRWSPAPRIAFNTLQALICGLVFFLIVSDLPWGAAGRRKLLWTIVTTGFVLALCAFFQLTPGLQDFYYQFFVEFGEETRNSLGSLIGHNTELSAWVLSSMLAALALLLTTRRPLARVVLSIHIVLCLLIIVAAQSRIAWPLAIALPAFLAWAMLRERGMRFRAKYALAGVALVLAIATAALLFRPGYLDRFRDYGKAAILRETRFRIHLASGGLIAQAPVLGHGIGSFMIVYPKAQGDFFDHHPGTAAEPTQLRTQHAHDDYLQVLIEFGAVGLLLLLAGLGIYARAGVRGLRAIANNGDRAQSWAFAAIAAQHAINGLVNFPAHVASSAYLFAACLGVWVNLRTYALTPDAAAASPGAGPAAPEASLRLPRSAMLRIGLLLACMVPLGLAPFFIQTFMRELIVSAHTQLGRGWFLALASPGLNPTAARLDLGFATSHLGEATRLEIYNWESQLLMSRLYIFDSDAAEDRLRAMPATASAGDRAKAKLDAASAARKAVDRINNSIGELQYHENLHSRALALMRLQRLTGQDQSAKIEADLREAVRISPNYYDGIKTLLDFYGRGAGRADPAELIRLSRLMLKYHPTLFEANYIEPARHNLLEMDYDDGAAALQLAADVAPGREDLRVDRVYCLILARRLDEARAGILQIERDFGREAGYWVSLARLRMAEGNAAEALEIASAHAADVEKYPGLAVVANICLSREGKTEQAAAAWNAPLAKHPEWEPIQRADRAMLNFKFAATPEAASADAQRLADLPGYPRQLGMQLLARLQHRQGRDAQAKPLLERALGSGYESATARQLLNEINAQAAPPAPPTP